MGPRPRPSITGGGNASGPDAVLRFMDRRISVIRGTEVNAYGDKTNVGTIAQRDVPAAIAETARQAFDPATQRTQIIRSIQAAAVSWADIELTDTILDPATGWTYMVEEIWDEPGIGIYPPRKLMTLRLRSGITVDGESEDND